MYPPLQRPERDRESVSALVVDDDDVDRERLRRLLDRNGRPVEVVEAKSKFEALEALKWGTFDFVFLDFDLGDGDGRELLPQIKEYSNNDSLTVAITGSGNERVAVSAIKSGVYEYLPKFELNREAIGQVIEDGLRYVKMQAELRAAEYQLQRRGLYDSLTELPNRNLFLDRLTQQCEQWARNHSSFAVLMIDLDHFKEINDNFGHHTGDKVLREVGSRFAASIRRVDTIARLGGDEFAAVLPNVETAEAAKKVASKIVSALAQPIIVDGHALSVGASVGIALCPVHAELATPLMALADHAMYAAKKGLEKIVLHSDTDRPSDLGQPTHALLVELEMALQRDELVMHFQPKIRLDTQEVIGFEALARWNHPQRGLIGPDQFIPAIEASSLLGRFTDRTVDLALSQYAIWREQAFDYKIAINISARVLDDAQFVNRVLELLGRYNIPPEMLELELTETALLVNPLQAREVVKQLLANGIGFSIDDFGVGFTSLSYLKDFSAREIKLDRSFMTGLEPGSFNASLVKSLSLLCNALGINFVAEGVEDPAIWSTLLELGCNIGQGYSIARPMSGEVVVAWLQGWKDAIEPPAIDPV